MSDSALRLFERGCEDFRKLVASGPSAIAGQPLRKDFAIESVRAVNGRDRVLEFVISTSGRDRYGDIVESSGCEAENYLKNPVVLWAHMSRDLPVAKALEVKIQAKRVVTVEEFTPPDLNPFGYMVYRMYREGYLNASSIGFRILEAEPIEEDDPSYFYPLHIKRWELLENSKVPVPANPECLMKAHAAGIDTAPLRSWCEKILDGEGPIRGLAISDVERAWKTISEGGFVLELTGGEPDPVPATDPTPAPDPAPPAPTPDPPAPEPPAPEVPAPADSQAAYRAIEVAADGSSAWIELACPAGSRALSIGESIDLGAYGFATVTLSVPGSPPRYKIDRSEPQKCASCGDSILFAEAKIGEGERCWHESCALAALATPDTEVEIEVDERAPDPGPNESEIELDGIASLDELRNLISESAKAAAKSTILGGA